MSDRERPDIDEASKDFSTDVYSPNELRERRAAARRQRRQKNFRRARNTGLATAGTGLAIGAIEAVLHHIDGKPLGRTAEAPAAKVRGTEKQHRQDQRARRVDEAIKRARAQAEAGEPAPQSGVIDVSEPGVTGSVDLDNPHPDDTTSPTGTGGLSPERGSGTGGIAPS